MTDVTTPAIRPPTSAVSVWSDERVAIIRRMVAPNAPDDVFAAFIQLATSRNLDPITRQIYLINTGGRNGPAKWMTVISVDGYRSIAEQSGTYAGSDDVVFAYADRAAGATGPTVPETATCTVWKMVGGVRCPFTATVHYDEYRQPNNPQWTTKPKTMLGKTAETHALRKAFPTVMTNDDAVTSAAPMVTEGDALDDGSFEVTGTVSDAAPTAAMALVVDAADRVGMNTDDVMDFIADHAGRERSSIRPLTRWPDDRLSNLAAQIDATGASWVRTFRG